MSGYGSGGGSYSITVNGADLVCAAPPPPPVSAALLGVPQATLQAWLLTAQQTMQTLQTGQQAVTVSYAEGQGHRQVTYQRTDAGMLLGWIMQLQGALGNRTRRALGVRF